jgi:hypothetical protein
MMSPSLRQAIAGSREGYFCELADGVGVTDDNPRLPPATASAKAPDPS